MVVLPPETVAEVRTGLAWPLFPPPVSSIDRLALLKIEFVRIEFPVPWVTFTPSFVLPEIVFSSMELLLGPSTQHAIELYCP